MSSEINSDRSKSAQDLRDLQESYRKKKQEIKEEGEQELEKVRAENRNKVVKEAHSGAAAVNHIKEDNESRIEATKAQTEKRLAYERQAAARRTENEKKAGEERTRALEEGLRNKQYTLEKNTLAVHKKESELRQKEAAHTAHIQGEHVERRQQVAKSSEQEVRELNEKTTKAKTELQQKHATELRQLHEHHKAQAEALKRENQETSQTLSKYSQAQLANQRETSSKQLEEERKAFLAKQENFKKVTAEALTKEKTSGEQRYQEIDKENRKQVEKEREAGIKNIEVTRKVYADEIARQHKMGDKGIADQKNTYEFKMNRLVEQQKLEETKLKEEHQKALIEEDQKFQNDAQRNSVFYKQQLLQKHGEYMKAQQKAQAAYEQYVLLKREQLTKTLEKEKREIMNDIGKYSAQKEDPFYRFNQARARVSETERHYIISADVPEHEKDNVKLYVRDDKAVISGARRFKDQIDEPNGRISTANYQTFRQEIPLERPVHEKLVERNWENGVLTLKIPKA